MGQNGLSWRDWLESNRLIVGGGRRADDRIGECQVTITDPQHPVVRDVPGNFQVVDEHHYHKIDPAGAPVRTLAAAFSAVRNTACPTVFVVDHPKARIVGIALGHDGRTHDHPPYRQLLRNTFMWIAGR